MIKAVKWSIVLLIWIYVVVRAYVVPITHDEAYSFLLVKTNYINALVGTANTHWLNSLGMKLGSLVSYHPFSLRLFSVLSWLLYGYSAIRISEQAKNYLAGFALLLALVLNPFLVDFFSLARGYGLACAFTLASLWQITDILLKKDWRPSKWLLSVLFASLAVFSNYTFLYYFLSVNIVYIFFVLLKRQWLLWPPQKWHWLVVGTSLIAVANLLFISLYTGDLEYGGRSGIFSSLYGSLINGTLYLPSYGRYVGVLTSLIVLFISICFIRALSRYKRGNEVTVFIFLSAVLFIILFLNFFFHVTFSTPYLLSRTTLILYPCTVVMIFYFFNELLLPFYLGRLSASLSFALILILVFHFLSCMNFSYCYEWKSQAETQKCLEVVVEYNAQNVLVHRRHSGVLINYYKVACNKYTFEYQVYDDKNMTVDLAGNAIQMANFDYAILLPPYDFESLKSKGINFKVLNRFPITGAIVLKLEP